MKNENKSREGGVTRAFVCIEFPDEAVREITRVQEVLGNGKFSGKMTEPENLHLTLKFLGEIDDEKLEKARKVLREIKARGFFASLGEAGTFSIKGNPRIVWIKMNGEKVWELQKEVDDALKEIFPEEERFMSHVTIARVKYAKDGEGFRKYAGSLGVKKIKFWIDKFYLKKSELSEKGPLYSVIEEYKLERNA